MHNAAIADTSATHNHSKESKHGKLVARLVLLLTQVHIALKKTFQSCLWYCGSFFVNRRKGFVSIFCGESNVRSKPLEF
jgi:hypothetical protein